MRGYLLDTNVVSEARKGSRCDTSVAAWYADHAEAVHYISAITMMEVKLGIHMAKRNNPDFAAVLDAWYEARLKPAFSGKVLSVDLAIAENCAQLHAVRKRSFRDALIGATALVHDLGVITRNVSDFEDMGVVVTNPWLKI